jgi:hypothetical protein
MTLMSTASNPTGDTARLAELIAAKLQLVELVARLGRRQLELIERGEIEALMKLLVSKQTVLASLMQVERQLDPFRNEDPERRQWPSLEERARCQQQAERCNAQLAEALELERQAEAAMLRRRDTAAESMAAAESATQARWAYAASPPPRASGLVEEG